MKYLITLLLALLIAFVSWPYYHLYRLDNALGYDDVAKLAPLVDMDAVRANSQGRIERGIDDLSGGKQDQGSMLGWLQNNVKQLTGAVVNETLSIKGVRDTLRELARTHTAVSPTYFLAAVDFAFFESLDTFLIRLGRVEDRPAYVRLRLEGGRWMVTDIIP